MRRCTNCLKFHAGSPTHCSQCGRTFGVRICSRGHVNRRTATYCVECGSADLTTPAPQGSLLARLSGFALYAGLMTATCAALLAVSIAAVRSVDFAAAAAPLVPLCLALAVLYWATTLLPGPVRKAGKAAGRALAKRVFKEGKNRR